MASRSVTSRPLRRVHSGPQAQRNSTDIVVVPPTPATAAFPGALKRARLSGMHRISGLGMGGIDLDNAEWGKKLMKSWPKKCTFVVREILQTERTYIASLEEIILGYMMPLHGYLLAQGEGPNFIHAVFGNINKLRQLHEELLAKLHAACGDPHVFADVFITTDFTYYREYCTHYTDANLFLQKAMNENEKLKLFITQCQHDLEHALPLHSHLIKPVQRILKYQLLLHEMLKYIEEEDVIHPDIKEAQDKMKKVAEEINTSFEAKRGEIVATPSDIARRRSKEIKSLQKSRSTQNSPVPPSIEKLSELQRSMEFEDSLTILRGNKSSMRPSQANSISSNSRRSQRPSLANVIGMFGPSKPAPGIWAQISYTHVLPPSPPPKPTYSNACSPTPGGRGVAPEDHESQNARPFSSGSESSGLDSSCSNGGGALPGEQDSPERKMISRRERKAPLSMRKSAPVVTESSAVGRGEGGDRNSLCSDSARAHLSHTSLESSIESTQNADSKPSSPEPAPRPVKRQSLSIPPKPSPPKLVTSTPVKKKPRIPPKQVILPDKPLLGHTAHKTRPGGNHRRVVPPIKPQNTSLSEKERFVIDMNNGVPAVSLPPVLQQSPPSPPPKTFYPSMLKSTTGGGAGGGVRSQVLIRQEKMIDEMIKRAGGGGSHHQMTHGTTGENGMDSSGFNKKVPLMPPTSRAPGQR